MRDNVENLRMDVLRVHMFADTNAARLSSTDYVAIKQVASALGDVLAGTEQVSEKCATESIALLRKYNQWRCGVIDSFDGNEGPNPRAITEAINSVCADTEALRARVAELEAAGAIAAEYLESKRVIDAGPPRTEGSFSTPKSWRHNDPEVMRFHAACAALNQLAARPEVRRV